MSVIPRGFQAYVGQFLETFQEFPPRQKATRFGVDKVLEKLTSNITGGN